MDLLSELKKINSFLENGTVNSSSLFYGSTGMALYINQIEKIGLKLHNNNIDIYLDQSIEYLMSDKIEFSFENGVLGILWLLGILYIEGNVSYIEKDLFNKRNVDNLFEIAISKLHFLDNDYLTGGLGIVNYLTFIHHHIFNANKYFEKIIDVLYKSGEVNNLWIKWENKSYSKLIRINDEKQYYNLGLAHGIPGILKMILILLRNGARDTRGVEMLHKGMGYMLRNISHNEQSISAFPYEAINDDIVSSNPDLKFTTRIGWCYGDLSNSIIMTQIGQYLGNEYYINSARKVFEKTLNREQNKSTGIVDNYICHGVAGVSLLYYKYYGLTQDSRALLFGDYYLKGLLNNLISNTSSKDRYSLLEGELGIGLFIIELINKNINILDSILLLD